MKRLLITILLSGIIAVSGCSKEVPSILNEGKFFDEEENQLGTCTKINKASEFITITKYYNAAGNLIGSCSAYNGPGASGGTGTGCNSEELLNEADPDDPLQRKWPKYICIINNN